MEMAFAAESEALVGVATQCEGAAFAAVEDIRQRFTAAQEAEVSRIQATFDASVDVLCREHAQELDVLRASLAEEHQQCLQELTRDVEARAAAAIARVREEASSDAAAKVAALETEVSRELGNAAKAAAQSSTAVMQGLRDTHAKEMEALRAEFGARLATAAEDLDSAQWAGQARASHLLSPPSRCARPCGRAGW
jgi:hypothetical protein